MKELPNPIRTIRAKVNLSQEAAAAKAGITQSRWSAIERRPTLEYTAVGILRKIAKALGCKVRSLVE